MDDEVNFGAEFAADRAKVAALREVAARAEVDAVLYRAAAESYDREAVAKARTVLLGGMAAAVLLLVLIVVLIIK